MYSLYLESGGFTRDTIDSARMLASSVVFHSGGFWGYLL